MSIILKYLNFVGRKEFDNENMHNTQHIVYTPTLTISKTFIHIREKYFLENRQKFVLYTDFIIKMATIKVWNIDIWLIGTFYTFFFGRIQIQSSLNSESCSPKHVQYWSWQVQEFPQSPVSQHFEEVVAFGDNSMLLYVLIFYSKQCIRFSAFGY